MTSSASISSRSADHKTSAPRQAHQLDQRLHSGSDLPAAARDIALSHGSLVWVLSELGFGGGTSRSTFNSYIKSLRKLGIPFFTSELGLRPNQPAVYSYEHTMELSVALAMRFYFAIPDVVLQELKRWRPRLYPLYRSALAHRASGRGAEVPVRAGAASFTMRGIFLDPQLRFAGGRLIRSGPPTALSPAEALQRFATLPIADRTSLPIPLTDLAIEVVRLAAAAPVIRRGPRRQNLTDE
jgi:hypothetical protein